MKAVERPPFQSKRDVMRIRIFFSVFLVFIFLVSCSQTAVQTEPVSTTPQVVETEEPLLPWWKTAVFYEIFVRSYNDSNGDGIGDFNGIIEKLDYLNDGDPNTHSDLGIDAIWLMPIHPSPSYHGYDVVNYFAVNTEYGTLDDFKRLLSEAHKRGIKIIIDMVLNHTSSQHPFFISSRSSDTSDYHDWYIWSETSHGNYWHETTVGSKTENYYGYFCDCMPDLNYLNPDVTQQMEKVVEYWISDIGVDGFRIDAAKHLIEEGEKVENTQLTHDWFKEFYKFYKGIDSDTYVVGEVASSDARMTTLYSGDQMDMIFNFELAQGFVNSAKGESNSGVGSAISFIENDSPDWNFATFLTNHDQNRVMSTLNGNVDKAKIAAALLLTSPGTPFIYYGEEIGMLGSKPDEDIRRPMQWSDGPNGGFTTGSPWRTLDQNYMIANVAFEEKDSNSLLNSYKQLITLRNTHPALKEGDYTVVKSSNKAVHAALRQSTSETVLIIINLSKNEVSDVNLSWDGAGLSDGNYTLSTLMGDKNANTFIVSSSNVSDYSPFDSISPNSVNIYSVQLEK
ncbi:DUF3459 domain-containing protein [bacterium]|nr:DUF3459 domain-containing protein [bacterium]